MSRESLKTARAMTLILYDHRRTLLFLLKNVCSHPSVLLLSRQQILIQPRLCDGGRGVVLRVHVCCRTSSSVGEFRTRTVRNRLLHKLVWAQQLEWQRTGANSTCETVFVITLFPFPTVSLKVLSIPRCPCHVLHHQSLCLLLRAPVYHHHPLLHLHPAHSEGVSPSRSTTRLATNQSDKRTLSHCQGTVRTMFTVKSFNLQSENWNKYVLQRVSFHKYIVFYYSVVLTAGTWFCCKVCT